MEVEDPLWKDVKYPTFVQDLSSFEFAKAYPRSVC
jgi:hypothetical protein